MSGATDLQPYLGPVLGYRDVKEGALGADMKYCSIGGSDYLSWVTVSEEEICRGLNKIAIGLLLRAALRSSLRCVKFKLVVSSERRTLEGSLC